jgi:Antibiotic biosynthesis monooxygenase
MTEQPRAAVGTPAKVGLVAFHYPRRDYAAEMLLRVREAAEFIATTHGCLEADCWLTEDGATIVTTGQFESAQALAAGFAAARAAGIDFSYNARVELRSREIFRLTSAAAPGT